MLIVLTPAAEAFAMTHDGRDALVARVEQEMELCPEWSAGGDWDPHIFSWHGIDNMAMTCGHARVLVDCVADDLPTARLTVRGTGSDRNAPPPALSKENDDGTPRQ